MGVFHLNFENFKTMVKEIEVNELDKISLIRTFVLFVKKILSIEYNFDFFKKENLNNNNIYIYIL
jgi:hypothetical protein